MPDFSFPEYLAANLGRAYPLAEFCPRMDVTGSVTLPDCLLADARLNVTPSYAAAGAFFVSRVDLGAAIVTVEISFAPTDGSAPRPIAAVSIDPRTAAVGDYVTFQGAGMDASVAGSICFGDLRAALELLTGSWSFGAASAAFEADAVSIGQAAVRAVELYNGDALVGSFGDALRLVAGRNVLFTRIDAARVRVDVQDGINVPVSEDCDGAVAPAVPIRTINGIAPNSSGNFLLATDECLHIDPADGGVVISDLCSKSCCGCDELAALVSAQQAVEALVISMQDRLDAVNSKVDSMMGNLLTGLSS